MHQREKLTTVRLDRSCGEMDMWHTVGPICVPVISETLVTKVLLQNELNNHLPLSGFIHQTTSGGVLTRGAICLLYTSSWVRFHVWDICLKAKHLLSQVVSGPISPKPSMQVGGFTQHWKCPLGVTRHFISLKDACFSRAHLTNTVVWDYNHFQIAAAHMNSGPSQVWHGLFLLFS